MLGFNRWHLFKLFAATLGIVGISWLALSYFIPTPPSKISIAVTTIKGTTFEYYFQRYRERFARANVKLEPRESRGSVENLHLLQDAGSGVQIAFMYGHISDGEHAPGLLSMGVIYNSPFWIFYSSAEPLDRLSQLKGKRIALGPSGLATRQAAERILGTDGVTAETAIFLPIAGTDAVEALRDGKVDAYFIVAAPESPAIQTMLRMPNVRLMSFARAEALIRIFPDLVRLTLPQGVFDIAANIPPNDVTLIATTVRILIRDDLHPQIVSLLLQTLIKEHGGPGVFQRAGEFPTQTDPEYPMAASVSDFYKNGPSFIQAHLPLQLSVYLKRAIALLVAGIAIGFPLFSFAPKLYRGLVEYRLGAIYRRLRAIEARLQKDVTTAEVLTLEADLERVDREISNLGVPMQHSQLFFSIKSHVDDVRARLAARLVQTRSHIVKVA
jgi:TRAP-type uncharacterized transport system substrate-binding protein